MQKRIKIAILGYGKMGKEIEALAPEMFCEVAAIIDNAQDWERFLSLGETVDVAIDFSHPAAVVNNIYKCFELHLPIVVGTTSWESAREEVKKYCLEKEKSLFYASNFSIGVNLFFSLNRQLSAMMRSFEQYGVKVKETHHTAKVDMPSGTALSLIDDILVSDPRYQTWALKTEDEFSMAGTIEVDAKRIEGVVGDHEVVYESDQDCIRISHSAKSRKGFAQGALVAARWLVDRKGFFNMNDLLKF